MTDKKNDNKNDEQKRIMSQVHIINYSDSTRTIEWRNANNQRHRIYGPAVTYSDGVKMWYLNGKIHRTDGPAVEYPCGKKEWYLYDKCITNNKDTMLSQFKAKL